MLRKSTDLLDSQLCQPEPWLMDLSCTSLRASSPGNTPATSWTSPCSLLLASSCNSLLQAARGAQREALPSAGGSAKVQRELVWILLKNHCSVFLEIALLLKNHCSIFLEIAVLLASWSRSACLAPFLLLQRQQQRVRKTCLDTIYLPWTPIATSKHHFKQTCELAK